MTLAQRTQFHLVRYHATRELAPIAADLHRAACDYFCMAQVSIEKRDIKGATYRYRQGVKYAAQAEAI